MLLKINNIRFGIDARSDEGLGANGEG